MCIFLTTFDAQSDLQFCMKGLDMAMKPQTPRLFEKSKKDMEKSKFKEGSRKEESFDRRQMKRGGNRKG